jgi:hypothetical protein
MEYLLSINGKRVILNMEFSKIGNCYSRLFIEFAEDDYINFDVMLGQTFKMKKEDFIDWLSEAEELPEEDYEQKLNDCGINYNKLKEILK